MEWLAGLDRATATQIAKDAVEYIDAQHAELRLLDLEYRLGLTSEETLLRAYENVAYLDASVLLGGTAVTTGMAQLGINLTLLRPAAALNALRARRIRLDDMIDARSRQADPVIASQFAELRAQGHGPQRHEGEVTPRMLEDRVLRGFDPMTGTTIDAITGGKHKTVRMATRITNEAAFVGAEAYIRRSPNYHDLYNKSVLQIEQFPRPKFEVSLPIEDVLGPNFGDVVEGVRRLGSAKNPTGVQKIDFNGGRVVARYELQPSGDTFLITLFPDPEGIK